MGRRAGETTRGYDPSREVRNSMLGDTGGIPKLPAGLKKDVRKHAKVVLEQNAHLRHPAYVVEVVRYADLLVRMDELRVIIDAEGYSIEGAQGTKEHPAVGSLAKMLSATATCERNLALTVPSKQSNVSREDQAKGKKDETPPKVKGKPALRLA